MNTITKHRDRPEYNTEKQQEIEVEARRKLRNYTKKVLSHHYLKAKKQASDEISRLISHWKFDVPGWVGDTVQCPVLHKSVEDLEVEQDLECKKEALFGRKDRAKMSKLELQNEALITKYDKSLPQSSVLPKSNKEKVRHNAFNLMSQFMGTEAATPMQEAFDREDYLEVFELALRNDMRHRQSQSMTRAQKDRKAGSQPLTEVRKKIENRVMFRPPVAWSELMDEIVKENNQLTEPDPHAIGHCSKAIKHLSGDLNYDDRVLAREEMSQCLNSLRTYPQSTAPIPKSRFDECACNSCINSKALSEILKDIVRSPSSLNKSGKEEIDRLFLDDDKQIDDVAAISMRDIAENT